LECFEFIHDACLKIGGLENTIKTYLNDIGYEGGTGSGLCPMVSFASKVLELQVLLVQWLIYREHLAVVLPS
jgi:hypothetical protein